MGKVFGGLRENAYLCKPKGYSRDQSGRETLEHDIVDCLELI